jgi:hypothetical protein
MVATVEQHAWTERVLGIDLAALRDSTANPASGIVTTASLDELGLDTTDVWQAACAAFRVASDEVDAQISKLQGELRDSDDPELNEISELGLNAMTGNTRVPLQTAIREAGDGAVQHLRATVPKLRSAIDSFRKQLTSDRRVAACDANPFGIDMSIRATYESALDQMLDVIDMV